MEYRSLSDIQTALQQQSLTVTALVQQYLQTIERNADLGIFLEVFETEALAQAAALDKRMQAGEPVGKAAGMVLGVKDNICIRGHRVSASSQILNGYTSIYSATAIERLLAEDVIIIGRLNCDEFAMGSSNENSAYGPVKNPIDPERVPGGSSGGSAAAVAANMCLASLGSDTGGSIRQPASFCGVVGLKPTYGRISRYGLIAYGSSFDQIGPIAHNADDAALLLEIMAGKDERDATSSSQPVQKYTHEAKATVTPKRFAVFNVIDKGEGIAPEVLANFQNHVARLRQLGHTVDVVDFNYLDYLVPAYYILTTAEASSNLARFDGIHYGYRSPQAVDLESTYRKSRSEGFGKEVKRRIMLGTFVLSSGFYDAYYTRAQKVRRLIREATLAILNQYDFIITPTTPGTAFKFGQKSNDPVTMYLEDIFTVQANIVGIPALSVPSGTDAQGLPMGIQLMGAPFQEGALLQAAQLFNT